jgi:hypothetical protein
MTAVAKRRLQAFSEQLVAPIGDQGNFESIPKLKKIGPDSAGPRVKGKVVIVTGQRGIPKPELNFKPNNNLRDEFSSRHRTSISTSICPQRCESSLHLRLQ